MWWCVVVVVMVAGVVTAVQIKRIPVTAVTAVRDGTAALPCEVSHPSDDDIILLLWFREPLTTPIYRLHQQGQEEVSHWSDEEQLGSRATLDMTSDPALLNVTSQS
ncbi:uncharacterized protein LOC121854799 [Homarus americanus]|uniref:uncharacterized protein LOC121854799 n=1 Tax=Homarus americanus TaxID=6706 RepID=UPI001C49694B|nr:uncharacterized protein LOC121854799 [Homarus americanus]